MQKSHFTSLTILINTLITVQCGLTCGTTRFWGPLGTIVGPSGYGYRTRCDYQIFPDEKVFTYLRWDHFKVDSDMPDCTASTVKVYIGCGNNEKLLGSLCSRNAAEPFPIYAHDGCIRIAVIHNRYNTAAPSFRAIYETFSYNDVNSPVSSYPSARMDITASSGVIASPNWPYSYRQSMKRYNNEFEWSVSVKGADYVDVFIIDMDMEEYGICTNSDNVHITYTDSYYRHSKTLCNIGKPLRFKTTGVFTITFKSPMSGSGYRGLLIGYIAYGNNKNDFINPENEDSKMSVQTIIIIATLTFVAMLVLFCIGYTYIKKKRNSETTLNTRVTTALPSEDHTDDVHYEMDYRSHHTRPLVAQPPVSTDEVLENDDAIAIHQLTNPGLSENGPPSYRTIQAGGEIQHPPPPSYQEVTSGDYANS